MRDVLGMIENLRAVVRYRHNVRIIVFVIVVKRVEKDTQSVPLVAATKYRAVEMTRTAGKPKRLRAKYVFNT